MGAINSVEVEETKEVVNDINEETVMSEEIKDNKPEEIQDAKLAALKAKLAEKNNGEKMSPARIIETPKRSINLGVVGTGAGGGRLAECFYNLGYKAVILNTAQQDLEHIKLPEENKLLLNFGPGGSAKELSIGNAAILEHKEQVNELISTKLGDCDTFLLCTSLGGGSGAGSIASLCEVVSTYGRGVCVLCALPGASEDSKTKDNALKTLSQLSELAKNKVINNLIIVDNAKIETAFSDVGMLDFFTVANAATVEVIDVFNTLSQQPSSVKSLDPNEFFKLFIDGNGCSVFGKTIVTNYTEDTAIAESVISNLSDNLLAANFNLKTSRYCGVIISANSKVWSQIPAASVNYAMSMISDLCNIQDSFKGIYTVESDDDFVKVYSFFSGLGLPTERVEQLKKESKEHTIKSKAKDEERNLNLKIETGEDSSVSAAEKIKQKIAQKSSVFGKINKNIIDRRK